MNFYSFIIILYLTVSLIPKKQRLFLEELLIRRAITYERNIFLLYLLFQ